MNHIRLTLLLIMSFICVSQVAAQSLQIPDLEYGDLSEVEGNKVFIVSDDLQARARICQEITSKYPDLIIVSRKEEANVILLYGTNLTRAGSPFDNPGSVDDASVSWGEMVAVKPIKGLYGERTRILWFTRKSRKVYSLPLNGFAQSGLGFNRSTTKGAVVGFIFRLGVSIFQGRQEKLMLNPATNSLQINFGRKNEIRAAQEFVKALKMARYVN